MKHLDYKELLDANGVTLLQGIFSKEEIDHLRCLAWLNFKSAASSLIQYRNTFPALLFYPPSLSPYRNRLAPIVQDVLGENVLQLNNQYYFRMPGDGDQFAWHQDICFRTPREKFKQIETGYLQTAIIVDPMGADNGGIEFALGSHKQGELNLVPRDNSEKGLRSFVSNDRINGYIFDCRPGDVLLWNVMIVHGSKPNTSNKYRSYYMNGFAKAECVDPSLNFPWYLKDGKLNDV